METLNSSSSGLKIYQDDILSSLLRCGEVQELQETVVREKISTGELTISQVRALRSNLAPLQSYYHMLYSDKDI